MPRRAVLFDLDGTLVDSLPDIAAALGAALADEGQPVPDLDAIRSWVGDGARALVDRAVRDPGAAEPVFARFRTRYRAAPVVHTRVYDGLAEVLDALDAAGCALGVLSNKPHDLTCVVVEQLLPGRFAAVAGHRAGMPLKPDPDAAHAILAELGVGPDGAVLVGDSEVDIATARAAGMSAVAVAWGLRPRGELEAARPDHLVDTPAQLLALLGDLTRS
jgi:phosphoglycolate phosphatase